MMLTGTKLAVPAELHWTQGSICARAQPMRDGVTFKRHLSLAGPTSRTTLRSMWDIHIKAGIMGNRRVPTAIHCFCYVIFYMILNVYRELMSINQTQRIIIYLGIDWGTSWLTHWGRVTHICVNKLAIIGSNNGLSPGRRQAIIWTNAGILWIGLLGTYISEILMEIFNIFIDENALENVVCETVAILSRPQCVLISRWPLILTLYLHRSRIGTEGNFHVIQQT